MKENLSSLLNFISKVCDFEKIQRGETSERIFTKENMLRGFKNWNTLLRVYNRREYETTEFELNPEPSMNSERLATASFP